VLLRQLQATPQPLTRAFLHTFLSAAKQQKPKLMAMLAQLQLPKKLVHSLQRLRQPVAFLSAQAPADTHNVC
jgi:hypothetical protein